MSRVKINIKIDIDFYNEFFIGGGKGNSNIDSYVLKDINGIPYIPGSTFKGKLRYMTTLVYNMFSKNACISRLYKDKKCNCLICDIFGERDNQKGKLNFSNLILSEDNNKDLINIRNGIAVNRYLGTVCDKSLFNYEAVKSGSNHFKGEINGYLDEETYKKQLLLLFLGFSLIEALGGFQSRGLGWLGETRKMQIFVDGKEISKSNLQDWRNELEV